VTSTIPDAIRSLFKVDVAKESPLLKNKAMSLVRNGLIRVEKEPNVQRAATYLAKGQETVLFNALVLNAVFPDPKVVKAIFTKRAERNKAVITLKAVLLDQSLLCGVALSSTAALMLVECVESDFDLYAHRLPNPFKILPQVALEENTNLLQALLSQAAMLDPLDSVLMAYLAGDLEQAHAMIIRMGAIGGPLNILAGVIESALTEAQELDDLLDQFERM